MSDTLTPNATTATTGIDSADAGGGDGGWRDFDDAAARRDRIAADVAGLALAPTGDGP